MKLHANAALSLNKRAGSLVGGLVEEGWSLTEGGRGRRGEPRRLLASGSAATEQRARLACSIAPRPLTESAIEPPRTGSRRSARCGGLRFTGAELAELLEMPETTVSGILTRVGLGRLGRLGLEPARRYERSRPGELVHVDVKKLGRISEGSGPPGDWQRNTETASAERGRRRT